MSMTFSTDGEWIVDISYNGRAVVACHRFLIVALWRAYRRAKAREARRG